MMGFPREVEAEVDPPNDVELGSIKSTKLSPISISTLNDSLDDDDEVLEFVDVAGNVERYEIKVRGVEYSVDESMPKSKVVVRKTIVRACSFNIEPGRMLAILGGSGSGKTTLLDILAGRIPADRYSGDVLVNNKLMSNRFKGKIGYVMQSDQLYPLLTVKETLYFAARLRLKGITRKDCKALVDMTLDLLRLSAVADSYVGNEQIRGISGGEKRRCTIGVDIIHQVRCC